MFNKYEKSSNLFLKGNFLELIQNTPKALKSNYFRVHHDQLCQMIRVSTNGQTFPTPELHHHHHRRRLRLDHLPAPSSFICSTASQLDGRS